VSWTARLKGIDATITPVMPPRIKTKKKPNMYSSGDAIVGLDPHSVAIQLKIAIPLGMAMLMLATSKRLRLSHGNPVANIWWTQSPKLRNPIPTIDAVRSVYATLPRWAKAETIVETIPNPGRRMMYTSG